MHYNILAADKISEEGLSLFEGDARFVVDRISGLTEDQVCEIIPKYHGLIVRAATQVTERVLAAATNLRVVARAGVGVDNIDVEAATRRGILVINSPDGNVTSAAEHAIALLFAVARNVHRADRTMRENKWLKNELTGVELKGKTICVIGFGKVGQIVGRVCKAIGMRVVVFDPFVSSALAFKSGIELFPDLKQALVQADFVTIHTPLNDKTRNLIDAKAFAIMRKGVMIINDSRGGIVNEADLVEALRSGKVAGAGLDVFEQEPLGESPLREFENVVLTPHLGASTKDAQLRVAIDVVEQMMAFLTQNRIMNAVNMGSLSAEAYRVIAPGITLCEVMGSLHRQLLQGHCAEIHLDLYGPMAEHDQFLVQAFLKGYLQGTTGSGYVNTINAMSIADQRGLSTTVSKHTSGGDYTHYFRATVKGSGEELVIAGSVLENTLPRIVQIGPYRMEVSPARHSLVLKNQDVPGIVGQLGTVLGNAKVNIADMRLGRHGNTALSLITVDSGVPGDVLDRIRQIPGIDSAQTVELPMLA